MRPVLQDLLDETATLEPKGRWTTSVVYWQDGTMQLTTQHGISGSSPFLKLDACTSGPIADATIREHLVKVRERRFQLERGSLFPVVVLGWLKRLQARFMRSAMMTNEELSSQPLSLEEWVALGELVTNPPPVPDWVKKAVRGDEP